MGLAGSSVVAAAASGVGAGASVAGFSRGATGVGSSILGGCSSTLGGVETSGALGLKKPTTRADRRRPTLLLSFLGCSGMCLVQVSPQNPALTNLLLLVLAFLSGGCGGCLHDCLGSGRGRGLDGSWSGLTAK
jgi:hypothetical protein